MTNRNLKTLFSLLLLWILVPGCYRDDTNFFPDGEEPEVSIFSDKSNNIMSCYVNERPWRTVSRTSSLFSRQVFEVYISKQQTSTLQDTVIINWIGYYAEDTQKRNGSIILKLPVGKNHGSKELSALQGQRININNATGYFTTGISGLNLNNPKKGSGNIYFHTAQFDSIAPNYFKGKMSGIFEADFNSFKILKGRFDHSITSEQVLF